MQTHTYRFACLTLVLVTIGSAQTALHVPGGNVGSISGSNVGIGTTTPGAYGSKLEVTDNTNGNVRISVGTTATSGGSGFQFLAGTAYAGGIYRNNANNNIAIWTASDGSVPRFTIQNSNGNVGIGTTTPNQLLEVAKTGNAIIAVHQLDAPAAGKYAQITLVHGPTYFGADDKSWQVVSNGLSTGEADLAFQYWNGTSYREAARITGSGNVGIGTSTPAYSLHSTGSIGVGGDQQFVARYNNSESYKATFGWSHLQLGNNGNNWIVAGRTATGGALTFVVNNTADYTYGGFNGIAAMHLASNGNVGIGTATPTHKLAVNGTIRAKEVIVDTGWSDYVFAKDYALAPLSEVEAHINAHQHLPGIPSAQEVAEHGVSMGDMQSKLLAKIEELTLHQIAQEKRLNAQSALLSEQSARLQRLEQENATLRFNR